VVRLSIQKRIAFFGEGLQRNDSPRPAIELYDTKNDPHQLKNLADDPVHANTRSQLAAILDKWMDETADSVPDNLSKDLFDRETGNRIVKRAADYRGVTPGEDRGAANVNTPGPR